MNDLDMFSAARITAWDSPALLAGPVYEMGVKIDWDVQTPGMLVYGHASEACTLSVDFGLANLQHIPNNANNS